MLLNELFEQTVSESIVLNESAKMVWARSGKKIVRKYRCTSGRKKGRTVKTPTACGGKLDLVKRMKFKKTLMSKGFRMRRKAKMTKRRNPISKQVSRLNKSRR